MRKHRRRRAWQPPKGTPPREPKGMPMWPSLSFGYVSRPMPKVRAEPGPWTNALRQSLERLDAPRPSPPALSRAERRWQQAQAARHAANVGWLA